MAFISTLGVCLGDTFRPTFSPWVGFEFRKDPQHIRKALPSRCKGTHELLGRL